MLCHESFWKTLILGACAALFATSSFAAEYDFPGSHETLTDMNGKAVAGAIVTFDLKLHERKFNGWAIFPPADLALCGMGKALGGVIGGFLGGPHGPQKSCWEIWHEDAGLTAVNEEGGGMQPVTDASGLAVDPANKAFVDGSVKHLTPALAVSTTGLHISFDYASAYQPNTTMLCEKTFTQPSCATMVVGNDAIAKAAAQGLTCQMPLTTAQLDAIRANAVESCKHYLKSYEDRYHSSFLGQFPATTPVPADANF